MPGSIWQEMYCPECKIYFGVHLDDSFSGTIKVICGICKHTHQRYVTNGHIVEEGRYTHGEPVFTIDILQSQCYPQPRVQQKPKNVRDGKESEDQNINHDLSPEEEAAKRLIADLWLDKYAKEKYY